jgi:8-oxo-dGTP diphosphatase
VNGAVGDDTEVRPGWHHAPMSDEPPRPPSVLVVGAAVVRHGQVLAARRTYPPQARGRWELPGGKVEAGEDPAAALVREVREELGCEVRVTGRLAGTQPIGDGYALTVLPAELVSGEPAPHEHDALRWLGPDELDEVPWLPADVPFLTELREVLLGGPLPRTADIEHRPR